MRRGTSQVVNRADQDFVIVDAGRPSNALPEGKHEEDGFSIENIKNSIFSKFSSIFKVQ